MKCYVLGDKVSIRLFNLLGIEGVVHSDNPLEDLDKLLRNPDVGVIFVTKGLVNQVGARMETYFKSKYPVVVEVPDYENPEFNDTVINKMNTMFGFGKAEESDGK